MGSDWCWILRILNLIGGMGVGGGVCVGWGGWCGCVCVCVWHEIQVRDLRGFSLKKSVTVDFETSSAVCMGFSNQDQ